MSENPVSQARDQYRMVIMMGAPGSGKTSLEDQWIQEARAQRRRVRVLDPQAQFPGVGEWPGLAKCDEWLAEVKERHRGLLVLDDADMYLHSTAHSIWRECFASFRHWGMDIVVNTRRTQEIPKLAVANASHVAIFRMRGRHARTAVEDFVGDVVPDILERVPREPYRYLLIEVDTGMIWPGSTKPRATVTRADTKANE